MDDGKGDPFYERLRNANIEVLVDAFNAQVGHLGWTSSRGHYRSALKEALVATGLDCSSFITSRSLSLRHRIQLENGKLVAIAHNPAPGSHPDPQRSKSQLPGMAPGRKASERHDLVYGHGRNGLVFIERLRAEELAAFQAARTWGEFRKRAPVLHTLAWESMGYDLDDVDEDGLSGPSDDDVFDPTPIPGYEDGDFPDFPEHSMLDLIPQSVQWRFGKAVETVFSGPIFEFDSTREDEIVAALRAEGFSCQKDQDLINQVFV